MSFKGCALLLVLLQSSQALRIQEQDSARPRHKKPVKKAGVAAKKSTPVAAEKSTPVDAEMRRIDAEISVVDVERSTLDEPEEGGDEEGEEEGEEEGGDGEGRMEMSQKSEAMNKYIEKYVTPAFKELVQKHEKKREAHSAMLREKFGTWGGTHHCWNVDNPDDPYYVKDCAEGHNFDNQTNWDQKRKKLCDNLNLEKERKFPIPSELLPYLELNFGSGAASTQKIEMGSGLNSDGNRDKEFADNFDAGAKKGGLSFDPDVVKDHFQKLQAGLCLYHEGCEVVANDKIPSDAMKVLATRLAAAMVHGGDFKVGLLGDSTAAGADSCFYDAWLPSLERQLKPMLGAAGVNIVSFNAAHNGGVAPDLQLRCPTAMLPADLDIVFSSWPFVTAKTESLDDWVKRSLVSGTIPIVASHGPPKDAAEYSKYGFMHMPGYAEKKDWYPRLGKSNWGRIDTGSCHVHHSRSGSSGVASRSWHFGPLLHELIADRMAYLFSTAAIDALDMLSQKIRGGRQINYLKQSLDRRTSVPADQLNVPAGLASCVSFFSGWGNKVEQFRYTDKHEQFQDVEGGADADGWTMLESSPASKAGGPTCKLGECPGKNEFSRIGTQETRRSEEACKHKDSQQVWSSGKSKQWLVMKVPDGSLKEGKVFLVVDGADATIRVFGKKSGVRDFSRAGKEQILEQKVDPNETDLLVGIRSTNGENVRLQYFGFV